jgi:hypothetical protein
VRRCGGSGGGELMALLLVRQCVGDVRSAARYSAAGCC